MRVTLCGHNERVMELRQIESFLRVADRLHFARAAESLGVAPSVISDQIRRLEDELDTRLFDRNSRAVALTAAGEHFRPYAERVAGAVVDAGLAMRSLDAGARATVRVGTGTGLGPRLWHIGSQGQQADPAVFPRYTRMPLAERLTAVTEGTIDVAIVRGEPDELAGRDLDLTWLWDEPLVAALQSAHPLAARHVVGLEELRGLPLALGGGHSSALAARVMSACRAAGFTPPRVAEMSDSGIEESLAAFALGAAAWTVFYAPHADQFDIPGVSFVPFREAIDIPTFAVTAGDRRIAEATANFLHLCREVTTTAEGSN